jgi:23S rRNA (guanosine2251-2'-O)-methyltransferase
LRTDRPGRPGARTHPRPDVKGRQLDGDLLYGRNGVLEALRGRRQLRRLFLAEGVKDEPRLREATGIADQRGIAVERIQRAELDELTGGSNHQGIALLTSSYPYASLDEVSARPGTVLVLDHLQDIQNMGSLLRAAEAAAVAGVVIARDRAADITPAAVNASAGAVEHLLVAREANLARSIELLKQSGRWAIALDTGPDAVDLFTGVLPLPAVLVLGSEGEGLTPIVRRACDVIAAIPMDGIVASLNAATAGSIAMFEIVRRTRADG